MSEYKKWKCVRCSSTCTVGKFDWWWDWNYANPSLYKWTPVSGWWIFKKWKCPQHTMSFTFDTEGLAKFIKYRTLKLAKKPVKMHEVCKLQPDADKEVHVLGRYSHP